MKNRLILVLLTFLAIAAAIGGVFFHATWFNSQEITFQLWTDVSFTYPIASILTAYFIVGALTIMLLVIAMSLVHSIKDWQLGNKIRSAKHKELKHIKGRELLAVEDFYKASQVFQSLLQKDKSDINSRINLCEALIRIKEFRKARDILEEARAKGSKNIELLFTLASLNDQLGNKTAACDNLALILKTNPCNKKALKLLAMYSTELGRYQEAVRLQSKLIKQLEGEDYLKEETELAKIELKAIDDKKTSLSQKDWHNALHALAKRHKDFPPLLSELANIDLEQGKEKSATKLFSRAYAHSGKKKYLEKIAAIYQDKTIQSINALEDAIDAARNLGIKDIEGQLFYIGLLLNANKIEEAQRITESLKTNTSSEEDTLKIHMIESLILQKKGQDKEALDLLNRATLRTCFSTGP